MADRPYDLVLFGATGFTGQLVAAHLRDHAEAGVRWAVAGRRPDALERLVADLGLQGVDVVLADSHDDASLAAMAASTRTVCTTVGPYARHGSGLVAACAAAGTDYCDLTGEVTWIRRMIDEHGPTAERTGARILHACGFDSVPSDLGVRFAQQAIHAREGVFADRVTGRVKSMRGGVSGGTVASGVDLLADALTDARTRQVLADPYSLNPDGIRGPAVSNRNRPFRDHDLGSWATPFVMAGVNARIVRRSHALEGEPWGRGFTYDEALLTGPSPLGAVAAVGVAGAITGGALVGAAIAAAPGGRRLLDRILPDAGSGPTPEAQRAGSFDLRVHAAHPSDPGRSLTARVHGDRDPGYGSTSRMLGEVALALAAGEAGVGGGSWTPASALGDALLRRLPERAGVTFTVIG